MSWQAGINIDHCVSALSKVLELDGASVELMFEGAYLRTAWFGIASLRDALHSKLQVPIAMKSITHSFEPGSTTSIETKGPRSSDHSGIVYIGGEGLRLANILITPFRRQCECTRMIHKQYSTSGVLDTQPPSHGRYAIVQKRAIAMFSAFLLELSVWVSLPLSHLSTPSDSSEASYLPLIKHLRGLISRANKKLHPRVGKLNPAKLANFIEVECFVLVACPETSLIDNKRATYILPRLRQVSHCKAIWPEQTRYQNQQSWLVRITGCFAIRNPDSAVALAENLVPKLYRKELSRIEYATRERRAQCAGAGKERDCERLHGRSIGLTRPFGLSWQFSSAECSEQGAL
ncbi:unnamed protein product [Mycena citricolor]|uniref:Uncharacterized protein n=1 Tax=Mycena citricolor TaxID=2018698 RepID=A0AAD2K5S5_9AGAR|nr:unnamed protein product [Mycena citricolor]